jgi:agmatine/peptidylarginine deiminase
LKQQYSEPQRQLGFHMPAEQERGLRCWMAFPGSARRYGKELVTFQRGVASIANQLVQIDSPPQR